VTSMDIYGMAQTSTAFCAKGGAKTWLWHGSWTELGTTSTAGSPECASTTGYVGGCRYSAGQYTVKGWLVDGGSFTVRDLPVASTGMREARGVNDYGLFTGGTTTDSPGFGDRQAWVYDWGTGAVTYLPVYNLAGDESRLATLMLGMAVNNAGTVVGVAREGETWWDGFVWTQGGGTQSLGILSSTCDSLGVYDVSGNGYVTGHINGTVFIKKVGEAGYVSTGIAGASFGDGGVNDTGMVATGSSVYHDGNAESIQSLLVDANGYSSFRLIDIDNRGWIIAEAWGGSHGTDHAVVLLTPVRGENVVGNSSFDSNAGLTTGGGGTATIVTDPNDGTNLCLQMTTGSPVYVEQLVDTPNGSFEIAFDYQVVDAGCTLAVSLDGLSLATLGPLDTTAGWVSHGFLVADPNVFDLTGAALRVTVDHGESGKTVYLDNLEVRVVNPVPEPACAAVLLAGASLLRRRRTRTR